MQIFRFVMAVNVVGPTSVVLTKSSGAVTSAEHHPEVRNERSLASQVSHVHLDDRLAPAFAVYRPSPPTLLADRPIIDPCGPIYHHSPLFPTGFDPALYAHHYRGFAVLPPPVPGFVFDHLAENRK